MAQWIVPQHVFVGVGLGGGGGGGGGGRRCRAQTVSASCACVVLHKHRVLQLSVDLTNNAFNTVQRPTIASQDCVCV